MRDATKLGEFIGLDLEPSKFDLVATHAIEANNVVVRGGHVVRRPGRLETAEEQGERFPVLGLAYYADVDGNRSIVLVRSDGIYQRST